MIKADNRMIYRRVSDKKIKEPEKIMKNFVVKSYEIECTKMKSDTSIKLVFLTDLHGIVYGENHQKLIEAINLENPDLIVTAGDLTVKTDWKTLDSARTLLLALAEKYRIYYAHGNHEQKMTSCSESGGLYYTYERTLTEAGICMLHNQNIHTELSGNDLQIYGLELPLEYYKKPFSPKLSLETMSELLGCREKESISILLAHNPKYGASYFEWGADLTLSGHYHGGMLRFGKRTGLISPQCLLFPPYCCGHFQKGTRHMIVSAGLGEHTIPVRIHNPRELLVITIKSASEKEKTE